MPEKQVAQPAVIRGDCVEVVNKHKYLGVQLDDTLDWSANTEALCKKAEPSALPLKAGVIRHLQEAATIFYQLVVASALLYAVVC